MEEKNRNKLLVLALKLEYGCQSTAKCHSYHTTLKLSLPYPSILNIVER